MRSVNKLTLVGHVGKAPEVRAIGGDARLASFSLATNRKAKGEDKTDWHRCVAFGKLADIVESYVKTGDLLYVEGRVEYKTSEKDGQVRYFTDIVLNELTILSYKDRAEAAVPAAKPVEKAAEDDGLPF